MACCGRANNNNRMYTTTKWNVNGGGGGGEGIKGKKGAKEAVVKNKMMSIDMKNKKLVKEKKKFH